MSIYNKDYKNNKKMFLDENLGVARYDELIHPMFDTLTKKQRGFFWQPEEVQNILKDKEDFKKLSLSEQHIFTSNLKRQILLDSVQGRGPSEAFTPICSIPELEIWLKTWEFFETIHSYSYTYIIRNVYSNPSKIFDEINNIEEIVDCAKDISKCYDDLIEYNKLVSLFGYGSEVSLGDKLNLFEHKRRLWLCLVSVNILEGVRFYVSFACSWSFAERKMMEGNAKIIKLICRDENCFDEKTEVLTNNGWKLFKDLEKNIDEVAQFNKDKTINFVMPLNYIEKEYNGKMIQYSSKGGGYEILTTPDHRMIYEHKDEIKEETAENLNPSCDKFFLVSGKKIGTISDLTWLDRLRIAFQADGSFSDDRHNGKENGCKPITFNFKKQRKIDRLENILKNLNFQYSSYYSNNGQKCFYINIPIEHNFQKDFNWVNLSDKNYTWCQNFIEEISNWDGHVRKDNKQKNSIYYSSINGTCVDKVQEIATFAGYRHQRGLQKDNRSKNYHDVHRIYILKNYDKHCIGNKKEVKKEIDYRGKVYCVSVPSGMIVVRRNNKVIVSGNCHLGSTQYILRNLIKEDEDFLKISLDTKEECIKMYEDCVEQEKNWAKYLFKDGSMIGLNENILSEYVEYIAKERMKAIGLPSSYEINSNPLPWTNKWVSGREVQDAPQEVTLSQYTSGNLKSDLTENTFKNIKL